MAPDSDSVTAELTTVPCRGSVPKDGEYVHVEKERYLKMQEGDGWGRVADLEAELVKVVRAEQLANDAWGEASDEITRLQNRIVGLEAVVAVYEGREE